MERYLNNPLDNWYGQAGYAPLLGRGRGLFDSIIPEEDFLRTVQFCHNTLKVLLAKVRV